MPVWDIGGDTSGYLKARQVDNAHAATLMNNIIKRQQMRQQNAQFFSGLAEKDRQFNLMQKMREREAERTQERFETGQAFRKEQAGLTREAGVTAQERGIEARGEAAGLVAGARVTAAGKVAGARLTAAELALEKQKSITKGVEERQIRRTEKLWARQDVNKTLDDLELPYTKDNRTLVREKKFDELREKAGIEVKPPVAGEPTEEPSEILDRLVRKSITMPKGKAKDELLKKIRGMEPSVKFLKKREKEKLIESIKKEPSGNLTDKYERLLEGGVSEEDPLLVKMAGDIKSGTDKAESTIDNLLGVDKITGLSLEKTLDRFIENPEGKKWVWAQGDLSSDEVSEFREGWKKIITKRVGKLPSIDSWQIETVQFQNKLRAMSKKASEYVISKSYDEGIMDTVWSSLRGIVDWFSESPDLAQIKEAKRIDVENLIFSLTLFAYKQKSKR